jgi:hypothetical protein
VALSFTALTCAAVNIAVLLLLQDAMKQHNKAGNAKCFVDNKAVYFMWCDL